MMAKMQACEVMGKNLTAKPARLAPQVVLVHSVESSTLLAVGPWNIGKAFSGNRLADFLQVSEHVKNIFIRL